MATIGQALTAPESGWTRYDNKDGKFIFSGSWGSSVNSNHWNGEGIYNGSADANSKITFRFYGTKLRWIGFSSSAYHSAVKITIDGISETFSSVGNEVYQALQYEKTGLSLGVHTVEVSANSVAKYFYFDAIDVDSGGYIITTLLGQALTVPEAGWQRYDNNNAAIQYIGSGWLTDTNAGHYQGTAKFTKNPTDNIKFTFIGTKIRIIASNDVWSALTATIKIDGLPQVYNQFYSNGYQKLVFEKTGLELSHHTIEIIASGATSTLNVNLDAIDIDSTGRLYHPDEVTVIKDLAIGKRIRCHYQAYTGAIGTFSGLGKETSDFIPFVSSATPDGDFYYIMVEDWNGQKRLIADRNVQHSISYDVLNSTGIASGSGLPMTEILGIGFFSSVVYVNPVNGSDTNSGSYISPVKTINKALEVSIQGGAIRLLDGIHTINTTNMSLHDLCTIKGITFVGNNKKTILEVPSCLGAYAQGVGTSAYFYNMIIRRSDSGLGDARMLWYSSNVDYKLRFYNVAFTKSPNGSFPSSWHFVWSPNVVVNNNAYFDNCSFVATPTNVESGSTTDVVRYRNCAFGNSTVSSKTLGGLFNSTFDSSSLNITSGNWMNAGVGFNSDGTATNIGVYGGGYNWSTFVVKQMDTEHKLTVRLPTGGISATDKDNEWDKYIVSSTLNGTIKAGDDNVWNWSGSGFVWCSTSYSTATHRITRGKTTADARDYYSSGTSNLIIQFRPVLLIDSQLLNKSFVLFNGEYKKWVEGSPAIVEYQPTTAIPKMTSNTSPNGRAFSSSIWGSAYDAWYAFDQIDNNEGFATAGGTVVGHLGYEFPTVLKIGKYAVRSNASFTYLPKNWTFEGSKDGTSWTVLDTRSNVTWTTANVDKEYIIQAPQDYKMYRLNFTANNGASYTSINELKMYIVTNEFPAIPSSLKTISITLPSVDTFKSEGMNDLSVLNRKSNIFTFPMDDNGTSGSVLGSGKVFKEKIDLKRFFDVNSLSVK